MLRLTDAGLYCEAGDFHIDPWRSVSRAVITHAHADHARAGSARYLTARPGAAVLRARLSADAAIDTLEYGESIDIGGARLSLHPAGHILGSSQVRVEHRGQVMVASGDYKLAADPTCAAFEPVRCHAFITEATFALPVYRWRPAGQIFDELNAWWRANQDAGRTSVVFAYSLGKAERVLASLDAEAGPILVHGAVRTMVAAYEASGVRLPPVEPATSETVRRAGGKAIVIAPPSTDDSAWLRRFGPISTSVASGWMQNRGARRRRGVDRGWVVSDHADWDGLLSAIAATGAERVLVTHGYTATLARWLAEWGYQAEVLATRYVGEDGASADLDATASENGAPVQVAPKDFQPGGRAPAAMPGK